MSTFQNQNQFTQTPVLGMVDMTVNPAIISVKIDPASVSTVLQSGQGFKIKDVAANEIIVDVVANATEEVFGVSIYNPRKNLYNPGDTIELALSGSVVYLEASAAIARGAKVQLTPATPSVQTLVAGTNAQLGISLDKPAAAATLCRILIKPLDINQANY